MNQSNWLLHPIVIFIFSIAALATSLFLYIYWYIEASKGLRGLIEKFNIDAQGILAAETWVVILVLSILVGIILLGIFIIFVYNQKTLQLFRLQHNFINNFTHELKTPVTSLKLFLQTFEKHELPRNDQLKFIHYMLADVSRLSDDINRILNLAKIEGKSYVGEFVEQDLVTVIDGFITNNGHLFQTCQIQLHNPSHRSYPYRINASLFEMLLMNIFNNAIKYNESNRPMIDISFMPHPKRLDVQFKDNGIGFDKSEIKKIFRKFYQIGRASNMTAKGSGLGLYLAQTIAHIHHGKVVAHSSGCGQGSTFTLRLPYHLSSAR